MGKMEKLINMVKQIKGDSSKEHEQEMERLKTLQVKAAALREIYAQASKGAHI